MSVLVGLMVTGLAGYALVFVLANRRVRPKTGPVAVPKATADLPKATSLLSVLTWNIGYAGLGEKADLVVDNGRSFRPLSAADMTSAAHGIADWLAGKSCDIICLQENANAGFLTRETPLRPIIEETLPARAHLFWTDMKTVYTPGFLQIDHGMSVHVARRLQGAHAQALPQDDTYILGLLKKHYGMLVSRFALADTGFEWVVFNVHLSAFDTKGQARRGQLQRLMHLAVQEYEKGNFVVIAGDWNMRLRPVEFTHQADPKHLSWVSDFPTDALPEHWQIAADPAVPTVRSLNAAYRAGENYTTIVDGFLLSPNVALERVRTDDQGFGFSDHHPVTAEFSACLSSV